MSTNYAPGTWIGVVAGNNVAFFDPSFKKEIIETIWASFKNSSTIGDLIEQVVAGYNARLSVIPPFAIATTQDGKDVHVIVRGETLITTVDENGTHSVTGGTTSTWAEQTLRNPAQFQVRLLADSEVSSENGFGIDSAIVLTAGLTATLRSLPEAEGAAAANAEAISDETAYFPLPAASRLNELPPVIGERQDASGEVIEDSLLVECAQCGAVFHPEPDTLFCVNCGAPLPEDQVFSRSDADEADKAEDAS